MKTKLIILIASILGFVIIIGCFIHFVTGVSSTYPPIRKYEYIGDYNQFIYNIRKYTSTKSAVKFKVTDTVGSKDNGYAIYLELETIVNQDSIQYGLKCEEYQGNKGKTIISLVEAYNKTKNTGGYSKNAKGVNPLVSNFDTNFLTPLKNSQNVQITPFE
jgi:hypothetical protein